MKGRQGLVEMLPVTLAEDEEKRRHMAQGGADVKREKEKYRKVRLKLQDNLMFNGKGQTKLHIHSAISISNHALDRLHGHDDQCMLTQQQQVEASCQDHHQTTPTGPFQPSDSILDTGPSQKEGTDPDRENTKEK